MENRKEIDSILRNQDFSGVPRPEAAVRLYAEGIAAIEKCVVVVSDLQAGTSAIFRGAFGDVLGLSDSSSVDSIWEKEILDKMAPDECEAKYMSELRFYNFVRHLPRHRREAYYMATTLRFHDKDGNMMDVLHRMFYRYVDNSDAIRFGICIYGPLTFALPAKNVAVNAVTGQWVELSSKSDSTILSAREREVLTLVERGMTSLDIAAALCISKNTVSRHRQEILAKLQVNNSTEACRRAKQLGIIV